MDSPLFPVLLSGGTGVRLWPVSREDEPKPFIKVFGNESLLQKTYLRAISLPSVEAVLTVTNEEYFFRTQDEYTDLIEKKKSAEDIENIYILEPIGRNTAPAIALAAFMLRDKYGDDATMLVLSADHLIENDEEFMTSVSAARSLADKGYLATFGMMPTRPETGYGYIKCGEDIEGTRGFKVDKFVEKPSAIVAEEYMKVGQYFWNAGIFCFKVGKILNELQEHCPDVFKAVSHSWNMSKQKKIDHKNIYHINRELFSNVPSISLDYAVMEKSKSVAIVPSKFKWNDVGSWDSMCSFIEPDEFNNRVDGKVVVVDSKNTYVQSRTRTVAVVGVEDLIIVDTEDAVLVAHRQKTQDVKKVVDHLRFARNDVYKVHKTVTCPWGTYAVLDQNESFRIRRIIIKPMTSLPTQTHTFSLGNWTVVSGVAKLSHHSTVRSFKTNESIPIPMGETYQLENAGNLPLVLIEIQSGGRIGDLDIAQIDEYNQNKETTNLRREKKNAV
jgi:mannose-1-phosphate guanylyltransferase / mannose-6-phosphate isomerase